MTSVAWAFARLAALADRRNCKVLLERDEVTGTWSVLVDGRRFGGPREMTACDGDDVHQVMDDALFAMLALINGVDEQ